MRRLLWLGIGLAVGALAVRAITKKAQALSPSSLAGSVTKSAGGLVESMRSFVSDVRDGMAEREAELHAAFVDGEAVRARPGGPDDFYVEEGNHR